MVDEGSPNQVNDPTENSLKPGETEAYSAFIGFAQHAEVNSWNRFYNFLMFNTILILAWSTIYSQNSGPRCRSVVLSLFCLVGAFSGVTWSFLGDRGRKYLTYFLEQAAAFESKLPESHKVCTQALKTRDVLRFRRFGSYGHLVYWPWGFVAVYVVLLLVSIFS